MPSDTAASPPEYRRYRRFLSWLVLSFVSVGSLYLGIAPVLAKIVGVGTAFLVNFWLNLRVVFRMPSVGRTR